MNDSVSQARQRLKAAIAERAFVRVKDEPIVSGGERVTDPGRWLLDVRRIVMEPEIMADIAELFWDTFREQTPTQVGGLEVGAIPLLSGLVSHAHYHNKRSDVSGFFIRKSRKKDGLTRAMEGTLHSSRRIILVDDLTNSGKSFIRQIEVLEAMGRRADALWVLVRFHDQAFYEYFSKRGIPLHAVFELDDFTDMLGIKNFTNTILPRPVSHFKIQWKFAAPNPSYHIVAPKSAPVLDKTRAYFGSDTGTMWAVNQDDGSVAWKYQIGFHAKGKGIFSSPALLDSSLYFGGYDGNIYALNTETGKKMWVSFEADWVGSSPALAPDMGLLFIGLEYGLWRKRGGIAALDLKSGKTRWVYREMPCYTHSSPLYIKEHKQVVIGSNDGAAYLFDARTGALVWKYESGVPTEKELRSGFSSVDIKESFAYDKKHDRIIFGTMGGSLCFVDRKTGTSYATFKAEYGINSTPVIHNDTVLASSLDKHLYCIDLDTAKEKWRWDGKARIFATPVVIKDSIYIGANTGTLTELDAKTGRECAFISFTERITNEIAYNPDTKRFFVPTFANELYCIERETDATPSSEETVSSTTI